MQSIAHGSGAVSDPVPEVLKPLQARVPNELLVRVKIAAARQGVSQRDVVIEALREYLKEHEAA